MTIIDTSALLALFRADDPHHQEVSLAFTSSEMRVVSPFVIAELDYLIASRFGTHAASAALGELASGAYELPVITATDLLLCRRLVDQYADLAAGLTDASLVVLADRYQTRRILTLDRRHFSVLRGLDGHPFELLP